MIGALFIASERVEHGDPRKTKVCGTWSLAMREVDSKRASFSPEHDLRGGPLCDTQSSLWKLWKVTSLVLCWEDFHIALETGAGFPGSYLSSRHVLFTV